MKKYLIIFLLVILISFSAFAQSTDNSEYKYSFQISPLLILTNTYLGMSGLFFDSYSFIIGFEFQYALNDYFTFSIEPRFGIGNYMEGYLVYGMWYGFGARGALLDGWDVSEKFLLFSLNPGLLFKPFGTALEGWYIGVYGTIGYKNLSREDYWFFTDYPDVNDDFLLLGLTSGSGYQWILERGFTISFGVALGYVWEIGRKNPTGRYMDTEYIFPLDFILNFKLGYSFK